MTTRQQAGTTPRTAVAAERRSPVGRAAQVGFLLALAALLVNAAVAAWNVRRVAQAEDRVSRSHRTLEAVAATFSLLQDAETGQRGYVLTADPAFLAPYDRAVAAIPGRSGLLSELGGDGSAAARLDRLVEAKLAELRKTIALVRAGEVDAARAIVTEGRGLRLMEEIRTLVDAAAEKVRAELARREAAANRAAGFGLAGSLAAALLGAGVIAVAYLFLRRETAARAAAAADLAAQRELFEVTLLNIGDGVITTDAAGTITFLNAIAGRLTGRAADARGRPLADVFRIVNEETRATVANPVDRVLAEGIVVGLANHTLLIAADGAERPIDDSAAPIRDAAGRLLGAVLVFRDVTESRRAERALRASEARFRFLNELGEATRGISDPEEMMATVARNLGRHLGASRCAYAEVEADSERFTIRHDYCDGCPSSVGDYGLSLFGPRAAADMREGRTLLVRDVGRELPAGEGREAFESLGIQAIVCCPLVKEGRLAAMMAVHQTVSRDWTADEVSLIEAVVERSWAYIERARADRGLRASEERVRLALDSAGLGAWNIDPAAGTLTTDERFRIIFRGCLEPVPYELAVATLHPDDRQRVLDAIAAATRPDAPAPYAEEYRVVHPDGSVRWVFAKGRANFTGAGPDRRLVSFDGTLADVTERKQADAERERLVSIVENSSDFIGYAGIEGVPAFVNRAGRELVGLGEHDDIGRTAVLDYFVPEQRGFVAEVVLPAALADGRWVGELTFRNFRTGAEIPVVLDLFRVDDPATGRPINFATVTRDITKQRQAAAALRQAEEQFRTLADTIPQLAWMAEPDGHIFWYNRRWYEYTGTTLDQMKGWGWESVHDSHELRRMLVTWRAALASGEPWEDVFPLRRADGEMRWHLSRAQPLRNERGEVVRWFGTNTDVTEQRRLESELRDADRRKDQFLATLAHELRNPLAPISNGLQAWPFVKDDPAEMELLREAMARQVGQMTRLIDDLLDVSRITQGKIALRRERTDLRAVLDAAVEAVRPFVEARGHRLTISVPDPPPVLHADFARLVQAFSNLINNAAKYTPDGGRIDVSARVEADPAGGLDRATVSVTDDGPGLPADMLGRIFEMFTQVDQTLDRAHGGLGIGLTLVKTLVELHRGTVTAASDGPGAGSTFTVTLPLAAAEPAATAAPTPAEPPAALPSARVLVVDDMRSSGRTLGLMLKGIGQEVRVEHDGPAALAATAEFDPQVVLLDIAMPGMNGYEVCRLLRERCADSDRRPFLVALTGYGQEEDRRRAFDAGFDRHLVKPTSLAALMEVLAAARP